MIRLLVQFKSNKPFNNCLELLAEYLDIDKAVEDGLSVCDNTVESMFINRGNEYLRIR